ncbi:class I SAM-dependent methyltransferase [Polynucleobacter paneuropaeus]|uniref:class I SAM-dependent methyltransferase n=1 Tax=Polynucleobacter paneuropaeus TaxID=2527775 RepID=UPI001BFDC24B|nr:class I SAM-dependent methyltransferase [Polynucleobacter paneuropaeus]
MRYIQSFLEAIPWPSGPIRVLDVGGGAGIIGLFICEWFLERGLSIDFWAIDLSESMLSIQRSNNPHITQARLGDLEQLNGNSFDLALVIDVIEHVPEHHEFAEKLNNLTKYIIYNIPTEKNLLDIFRNFYMGGRYFPLQTKSLGHIHFFYSTTAKKFVRSHHELLRASFSHYAAHLLATDHPTYQAQRQHKFRLMELQFSAWIRRYMPFISPWLVQGSLFILAQRGQSS